MHYSSTIGVDCMIAPVIAVGVAAWLLLREPKAKYPHDMFDCATGKKYVAKTEADHERMAGLGYVHSMDECAMPETPDPEVAPDLQKWTDTASWSGEYAKKGYDGTERVVWFLTTGIRFTDGTTEMSDTTYILIGNKNHTAFRRTNSDKGTVDIKKEYTGGDSDVKNATVYASLEAAEAEVDRLSVKPESDPNDPYKPQPQPEEEEEDNTPPNSFPPQQGLNLGQNAGVGSYGGF